MPTLLMANVLFTQQDKNYLFDSGIGTLNFLGKQKSQQDQIIVNTINLRLDSIRSSYLKIDFEYKTQGKILTKELLRQEFDAIFKGLKMEETPIGFDDCFEDFYNYKLKEGIWSKSTATRYKMIYKLLKEYESQDLS